MNSEVSAGFQKLPAASWKLLAAWLAGIHSFAGTELILVKLLEVCI